MFNGWGFGAQLSGAISPSFDFKASVRLATAAALPANTLVGATNTLTANAFGALPNIDGVAAVVGDRILVKDEGGGTSASNGIYVVTSLGSAGTFWVLTRSADADSSADVTAGMVVPVEEGTVNHDTLWLLSTNNPITLNTTALTFIQFGASSPNASTTVAGLVEMATQAETYAATPYAGGTGAALVPSITNLLVRRQAVQNAIFTAAAGSAPNARGARALDIQTTRSAITQVASGQDSTALGSRNTSSGAYSIAIGFFNVSSYGNSIAIGQTCTSSNAATIAIGNGAVATQNAAIAIGNASNANYVDSVAVGVSCSAGANFNTAIGSHCQASAGPNGVALGSYANSSAAAATALGAGANARVPQTTNICGPIIIRKDNAEAYNAANKFQYYGGVEVILMSQEINFKLAANDTEIALPAGCRFFVDEIDLIATNVAALVSQPTVQAGITGSTAKYLAPVACANLTATWKREVFSTLLADDGESSAANLSVGWTVAANAGTFKGRFAIKGILIEA